MQVKTGRRTRANVKASDGKGTFKRMLKQFKPQLPIIIFVIVLSSISSIIYIIAPIFLRNFLDASFTFNANNESALFFMTLNQSNQYIVNLHWDYFFIQFGILVGLYSLSAILSLLCQWLSVKIGTDYSYNERKVIKDKIDRLPLSYFDKIPYGDTLSTGTNDVDNISRNLQSIIDQVFSSVILFAGTFIAMFVVEWRMALVALASLPLTILDVFFISKFSKTQFKSYRDQLGILNGKIEENYSGFKIIKLFSKETDTINNFNETNKIMTKNDKLSQFLSGIIYPSTNFINNLSYVGVAVVGGLINEPASMLVFFIFLRLFTLPFQQLGQIVNIIQSVLASQERIYNLLDEPESIPDDEDAIASEEMIKGNYLFDNVSFSYEASKPLIENMNLKINQGDMIAIVGPTGAGKTTLVNLLMRFYEINSGTISLDGVDIRHYKRNALRGAVGMVLQDTWLFKGTVRDNIKYGNPEASDEEMIEACREAHADHFIDTFSNGYDFMLNESGTNISQGQRQLLTIARAILSKPKILILDEATSSVDTRTEKAIQDALDEVMKGRTSFVIAHRLSTIKNAKNILVMNKGKIIESGTHEELLRKNGFYAELYNAQFLGTINDDNQNGTKPVDNIVLNS